MMTVKYVLISFLSLSLLSCDNSNKATDSPKNDSVTGNDPGRNKPVANHASPKINPALFSDPEKWAVDTVFNLPEVVERSAYVEKQTKGKRHLTVMSQKDSAGPEPLYMIRVMEDNGTSMVTHFTFYVDPVTKNIFFYDVVEDDRIPLEAWRRKKLTEKL